MVCSVTILRVVGLPPKDKGGGTVPQGEVGPNQFKNRITAFVATDRTTIAKTWNDGDFNNGCQ